jgi:hypothetical protein
MHLSARTSFLLIAPSLLIGSGFAQSPPPTQEREFFISIARGKCELEESGRLADPSRPDESKLLLRGAERESEPNVLSCAVEFKASDTSPTLSACRITGVSHASLYFFRGDPKTISRSCSVRRLTDGTLEFHAQGVSSDQCNFTCESR